MSHWGEEGASFGSGGHSSRWGDVQETVLREHTGKSLQLGPPADGHLPVLLCPPGKEATIPPEETGEGSTCQDIAEGVPRRLGIVECLDPIQ